MDIPSDGPQNSYRDHAIAEILAFQAVPKTHSSFTYNNFCVAMVTPTDACTNTPTLSSESRQTSPAYLSLTLLVLQSDTSIEMSIQ